MDKDTSKVTRVEVIDHTAQDTFTPMIRGRVFSKWKDNMKVELSFQDGGKTLKIFLTTLTDK